MADEVKVTVTVCGAEHPTEAVVRIIMLMKRGLYLIDGIPGEFGATIEASGHHLKLDENREWQRVRDSNSRGSEPNRTSNAAP